MILVDNKLQIAKYRLAYIVTFAVGIIFVLFALFSKNSDNQKLISLIIGIVLLLIFCLLLIIKPEYIYIAIEKNSKIIFRNYTAFPLFRKYKAFEIPIKTIHNFEINKNFFGLRKFMRLVVKSKNMLGKYPWLSLGAVPAKDIDAIIKSFNKFLPTNSKKNS